MPESKMSKQFTDREKELVEERGEQAAEEVRKATKHYFAPAKQYQIANFIKEKYEGGKMIQRESSIRFFGHICSTKDPKEIAFIESCGAFEAGVIKKCATIEEAQRLAAQADVVLTNVRTVTTELNVRQPPITETK
ncbi:hypothetical protein KAR91_63620 [Candidatus Pacearchaeota archaeon]|nr:hypothetical protein [Candidatus Pacearchaeota archaeon]